MRMQFVKSVILLLSFLFFSFGIKSKGYCQVKNMHLKNELIKELLSDTIYYNGYLIPLKVGIKDSRKSVMCAITVNEIYQYLITNTPNKQAVFFQQLHNSLLADEVMWVDSNFYKFVTSNNITVSDSLIYMYSDKYTNQTNEYLVKLSLVKSHKDDDFPVWILQCFKRNIIVGWLSTEKKPVLFATMYKIVPEEE